MYDLIIKNANIIDGTGSPAFSADIAIQNHKIALVGHTVEDAVQIIDATGLTASPGFIDSHSHSDSALFTFPDLVEKIEQGITTSVAGQCGSSRAPTSWELPPKDETNVFATMSTFLNAAKQNTYGSNTACFVGHRALRCSVMGKAMRDPTPEELEKMKALLRDGMEHGALGVSFGLIYSPSCFAKTAELIELAKVVGEYHGVVSAHIRNEGSKLISAVEEFIEIIRQSDVRGVISHHKAAGGKENWGKVSHTLRLIDQANAEGMEIYLDVYPYSASSNKFSVTMVPHSEKDLLTQLSDPEERKLLKQWGKDRWGDDLSWVLITNCEGFPEYNGMFLSEIAKLRGTDVYDAAYDMIAGSRDNCTACYFTMCEADVEMVLAHPRAMICTDGGVAGSKTTYHPRMKASFPRALGRYVRERGVTSLPEMIRKMTSMPARVYGLHTKGLIWEGMDADICLFDPERILDKSTYTDCNQRAEGLNYVILGGKVVAENAVYNGTRMGRLLLKEN